MISISSHHTAVLRPLCCSSFYFHSSSKLNLFFVLKSSLQQCSTVSKPGGSPVAKVWLYRGVWGNVNIVSMSSLWVLLFTWNCMYWYQLISPINFWVWSCLSCLEPFSPMRGFSLWILERFNCILCSASLPTVPGRSVLRWVRNVYMSSSPMAITGSFTPPNLALWGDISCPHQALWG